MRRLLFQLVAVAAYLALALPAPARDKATGDWGGTRTQLSDKGVDITADYTAESFARDDFENGSYLGNLDVTLTLDTEKLGWWSGGTFFFYGETNHSSGISRSLDLLMPVSNFDAPSFTELAEFWLEQKVGDVVTLRLGKQDSNRDFARPRFAGNFVNSSFGVLPGSALPSFPASALGAAILTSPTPWLEFDAGIYEGNPEVGSFGESAFEDDSGVFAIGAVVVHHPLVLPDAGLLSFGGWTHSNPGTSGMYGIYDLMVHVSPHDKDDPRTVQFFVRGAFTSDEEPGEIGMYAGGGLTFHGFLGRKNTIGIGTGYAETDADHEAFVELFFKWRPVPWFTVEPDVQVYDTETGNPVFFGARLKLKM